MLYSAAAVRCGSIPRQLISTLLLKGSLRMLVMNVRSMVTAAALTIVACTPLAAQTGQSGQQSGQSVRDILNRAQSQSDRKAVEDLIGKLRGATPAQPPAPSQPQAVPPVAAPAQIPPAATPPTAAPPAVANTEQPAQPPTAPSTAAPVSPEPPATAAAGWRQHRHHRHEGAIPGQSARPGR